MKNENYVFYDLDYDAKARADADGYIAFLADDSRKRAEEYINEAMWCLDEGSDITLVRAIHKLEDALENMKDIGDDILTTKDYLMMSKICLNHGKALRKLIQKSENDSVTKMRIILNADMLLHEGLSYLDMVLTLNNDENLTRETYGQINFELVGVYQMKNQNTQNSRMLKTYAELAAEYSSNSPENEQSNVSEDGLYFLADDGFYEDQKENTSITEEDEELYQECMKVLEHIDTKVECSEEDSFIGLDKEGVETTFYKLVEFDDRRRGDHFIIYTDNTKDDKGNLNAFASRVVEVRPGEFLYKSIEDSKRIEKCRLILSILREQILREQMEED